MGTTGSYNKVGNWCFHFMVPQCKLMNLSMNKIYLTRPERFTCKCCHVSKSCGNPHAGKWFCLSAFCCDGSLPLGILPQLLLSQNRMNKVLNGNKRERYMVEFRAIYTDVNLLHDVRVLSFLFLVPIQVDETILQSHSLMTFNFTWKIGFPETFVQVLLG